jgi:hypothetical protein
MIASLTLRPFAHPRDRRARLWWLGLALAGAALLALWNPAERPGPTVCLSRLAVGLPCPLCGLTRGCALCLRGQPARASRFNPLAVPACLVALLLVARWGFEYAADRRVELAWRPALRRAVVAAVALVLIVVWVYQLTYRREDEFARSWVGRLAGLVLRR